MHGLADLQARLVVTGDDAPADREPEEGLAASATLAFRVAYGVLRHRQDAEDVAQDALVRAHRKRGALRDPSRFRAWLVRICWRLALDHRRAVVRRQRREQAAAPREAVPHDGAAREFRERLWREVEALPEKLRFVMVMAAIEGYSVREVARLLDLPEGTVKSRLFLARKRLMEKLR